MPFITFAERMGIEKGRQEGLQEGQQEGLQEGWQEGLQEGRQEGLQEGRQGVLEALSLLLKFKFGEAGMQYASELNSASLEQLRAVLSAVEAATTVEELRAKADVD